MATIKPRELLKQRQQLGHKALDIIQNPLGIAGGVVNNGIIKDFLAGELLEGTSLEGLTFTSGTLSYSKYWRYKLLLKKTPMEKTEWSPRPSIGNVIEDSLPLKSGAAERDINAHTTLTLSTAEATSRDFDKIYARRAESRGQRVSYTPRSIDYIKERIKLLEGISKVEKNNVFIINTNSSPYMSIQLQNRPNEVKFDSTSAWTAVASIGRNNPFRVYNGNDDSVTMDISWFVNDPNRRDEVLYKCKLLESWTKADGYMASPPLLQILWGDSDLFRNEYYVLESANYHLTHFQDKALGVSKSPSGFSRNFSEVRDIKLNPNFATQTLVFKKVIFTNSTHNDIVPIDKLKGIQGLPNMTISV